MYHREKARKVHHLATATRRRNVVELDEVHVFTSPMPCDLKEIAYAREAAFAGETRRDLFERDRDDGIDFYLAFLELVSPSDTNVRTHPDANASRDRTTSHAIAQVFREQHRASLARCFRSSANSRFLGGLTVQRAPALTRTPKSITFAMPL